MRFTPRGVLIALSALLLGLIFVRYLPQRGEDFIYYYCAGRSAARGQSPYEGEAYQACLAGLFGVPNPNVSKDTGSVYPPPAIELFRTFAALPYPVAFYLWNAALLAASVLLLFAASSDPADWLLLLTWPAFISCWVYHKLTIFLFLIFLIGLRLVERDRPRRGGALLSLLCIQPQWLGAAALHLFARKRWRALGALAAAGVLFFAVAPWAWFPQWLSSAVFHSNHILAFDNQSLFFALYRPFLDVNVDPRWFERARYGTSLALGLLAWRCAAGKSSESLGLFLGLVLLAQPYSHLSDGLWIFPLLLAVLARARSRFRWSRARTVAAGLLFNAAALALAGGFVLGRLNRPGYLYRQGYLAFALAALYVLSRARDGRRETPPGH